MRNRCTNHLKKAKIRASWNKYNLYNLSRTQAPNTIRKTFFQQKWLSKSLCRDYHGEQVREGQWEKMFSRRVRSVVPMKARYLAFSDGSHEALGRGSGLDQVPPNPPSTQPERKTLTPANYNITPYSSMTFAPLERRLDVAVFRALFASSARQARQFVIHGAVTVNGKKMQYPGYLLNPGDLFQVDPERVMFATGAPKDSKERRSGRLRKRVGAKEDKDESAKKDKEGKKKEKAATQEEEPEDSRKVLKGLLSQAKGVMAANKGTLPAKRKQDIRGFQSAVRRVLSRSSSSTVLMANLESQFAEIKTMLDKQAEEDKAKAVKKAAEKAAAAAATEQAEGASAQATAEPKKADKSSVDNVTDQLEQLDVADYSREDLDVLRKALQELQDNPIDSTKPYATPWRPRDYMSAFAFIPRYLEVNQNICAAVYLRHPVARPGQSEVPSPQNEKVATLVYNWYLRRR